jgi:hypothetical protein
MQMVQNVVLFQGTDANGHPELWELTGTAGAPFELAVAGANASGLSPSNLTVYNGEVLFEGLDSTTSSGSYGLWVTTGAPARLRLGVLPGSIPPT